MTISTEDRAILRRCRPCDRYVIFRDGPDGRLWAWQTDNPLTAWRATRAPGMVRTRVYERFGTGWKRRRAWRLLWRGRHWI